MAVLPSPTVASNEHRETEPNADAGEPSSPPAASPELTAEELIQVISRLVANETHTRCREGSGPLAPIATALNDLSAQLFTPPPSTTDLFGPQTLVDQTRSFMATCDTDARIHFMNHVLPGWSVADVLGTSVYRWLDPTSAEPMREAIRKVLATGELSKSEIQTAPELGGGWFTAQVAPIQSEGRIVGFSLIHNDITDLKLTQLRLERSNQELESFAYVSSHDLQEPLRKIQTFGERLKATCSDALGPEGRDYVERMQKAASRMRGLIDDLLAFSRVSSKARPFTRVDLGAVAREVLGDLAPLIARTGARITLGELPVLEADPLQMRQLLHNLLANALKFRREGVPPLLSVRATLPPDPQHCEWEVEDNGIGFEEQHAERIFNVFQRLHGRDQYEGTGIGLAICRKIAERHGGGITARGTPGVGSIFHVSLPLKQHTGA